MYTELGKMIWAWREVMMPIRNAHLWHLLIMCPTCCTCMHVSHVLLTIQTNFQLIAFNMFYTYMYVHVMNMDC